MAEKRGKPFAPEKVVVVEDLPRTRSGKITRRVIRDLAFGVEPKELSVIENPESIEKIRPLVNRVKEELGR